MLSENIRTSNHANGFCFLSDGVSRSNLIVIVLVIPYNVIVIDYIVILFNCNRNRAGGN